MKSILLLFVMFILTSQTIYSETMSKVVVKQIYPEVPNNSFSALPTTYYKYGSSMGRIEELPDSLLNLHQLMVYNKGDFWMVNLMTKEGKYIKDPGPTLNFYATVFPRPHLFKFEFTKEREFLTSVKGHTIDTVNDEVIYSALVKDEKFRFIVNAKTGIPKKVELYNGKGVLELAFEYIEYNTTLELNNTLFVKPKGIHYSSEDDQKLSLDEIAKGMMNFCKTPHDVTLLKKLIISFSEEPLLRNGSKENVSLGFFCGAFSINDTVNWKEIINSSVKNDESRELLHRALTCAMGDDTAYIKEVTPEENDFYWSKFFATGDELYVNKIIDNLKYLKERKKLWVYAAAGSAQWSLASNSHQSEKVKSIIEQRIKKERYKMRKVLRKILKTDPQIFREEMTETMRKNKDNWVQ